MSSKDGSEFWELDDSSFDAKDVYVLMQNDYRISRNIRAQWYFKNVNTNLTLKWKTCREQCKNEIEIISAIPKCTENYEVDLSENTSTLRIVSDTKIHFLSTQYRLVFCLDLSSSVSTVDIQHDNIHYEEIFSSLEHSLRNVSEPFFVPGSEYYFEPQIYLTVIAHIPNCAIAAPQVLIQGWILTHLNVQELLDSLQNRLQQMCKLVKIVSGNIQDDQIEFMMPHNAAGSMIDGTIDGSKMIKKVLDLSADTSTLNLIRYGILALQLLPENSSAGIVVITDGVLNFPNCKNLDSLLNQLRNSTIACSFLQLGSPFYSFSCFGRAPYKELMEFIATATCGAYFPSSKYYMAKNSVTHEMNAYHEALLLWNFQKMKNSGFLEAYEPSSNKENYWHVENQHFYSVAHQSRVKKKHTEGTLKVSLENLLSCRIREGYSVKSVTFDEGKKEIVIRLVLPWMLSTNIEYLITSRQWKANINSSDIPSCHFEVIVDGCYEFLHDVTCSDKKPIRSVYRKTVISQFWSYIKNLSNTDQILTKLHSFALNPIYYTIPENIKNGVPLFYFSSNSSMPMLSSKNLGSNVNFTSFWKTLCMLDINVWQKWMHAHRIGIILQHDTPLQKDLHHPNLSGRYGHVQCRQATAALNKLLSENCSFVLVENHSYIKLLFDDPDKPPVSFYVIRVTSKPPCVVIRLAFLGGLPGLQRFEIVNELRNKILNLKLPKQSSTKDYSQSSSKQLSSSDLHCCIILRKPVEKILIRYEKLPSNFLINITDSQNSGRNLPLYQKNQDSLYSDALVTLSKYLLQQRWIWTLQYGSYVSLDLKSASKILYALTNIRLQEGFHFSHSSFGVIYLVKEIPMEVLREKSSSSDSAIEKEKNCCIVQYIIFPPHTNTTVKDSISEEDETEVTEADGELQLITECWVEPQHGSTVVPTQLGYLNGLNFTELPMAIHKKDLDVVKVLTTFEHLCTICNRAKMSSQIPTAELVHVASHPTANSTSPVIPNILSPSKNNLFDPASTVIIPYAFNLMSLLIKCPQVESSFSTLHEIPNNPGEEETVSNNMFFEYLLESLKHSHDQEIHLTTEDCAIFLLQVYHRERNDTSEPKICFPHPEYTFNSLPHIHASLVDFDKCKNCSDLKSSEHFIDSCSGFSEDMMKNIPKWRCFAKGYTSSHVILTLVPETYDDLKKLYFPNSLVSPKMSDESVEDSNIAKEDEPSNVSDTSLDKIKDTASINENMDVFIDENAEADIPINENAEGDAFHDDNEKNNIDYKESLLLPIYTYNCVSTNIMNQLVQFQKHKKLMDTYEDHTFECECCTHSKCTDNFKTNKSANEKTEALESPKQSVDIILLKEYCSLLEKAFSKAFVYGVYRSLMMGVNVQKFDAIAAIDNICEESLLEVDITEFVFMICGHVKDFFTKRSFMQMHSSQETDMGKTDLSSSPIEKPTQESLSEKCCFPMSMLQKYQPCEELHQKHLSIKKKFLEIIESYFKRISSRPDYYYFSPSIEDLEEESVINEGNLSQEEDALSENIPPFEDTEIDKSSNLCEEDASSKSFFNTNSSVSSIDKDTEPSSLQDSSTYPPLIVHFSCSVKKTKQDIKSCPLTFLPTCLNDIIKCLDTDSNELSLDDLRITLDIYCLTVPNDVENPILQHRVNSTSYSSNSPIPEAEIYKKHAIKEEENDSNCSDVPSDTLQGGTLSNLPSFQRQAVHQCVEKVQWLLQDEKASVALNCFPITSSTLDMVVEHVKISKDKPCCLIKDIPLMFVYGSESSLDKFTQAFKRMSPTGYRLEEIGDRYYLVNDTDAEPKCNLESSLEISQFDILKRIPHSDDGTELKRIVQEIKDTSVFAKKEFSFPPHTSDTKADLRESEVENEVFSLSRAKRSQPDEDSETEDCLQDRPKARFRKTSIKKGGGRSQSKPSLWETERKSRASGRNKTAKINLSLSRSISTGDDNEKDKDNKLDNAVKEANSGIEVVATSNVEEPSSEASIDTKLQHDPTSQSGTLLKTSDSDDPSNFYKDSDYENVNPSNTEDGYDGDSSDSGSDLDLINSLEHTRRPVLPKFWLIMNICPDKVVVYFHMRHREEDDPEIIECKSVLNEVVQIVNKICKEVNQILLLQSLYDTRMCDQLLVPEENEDLWKKNDPNRTLSNDDPECVMEMQEKYLEATLKFDPGAFGCPVVWVTHFRLHHRLCGSNTGPYKATGMSSLRSVLNTFSVNNRENMFVYRENTGNVFYIRLSEMPCDIDHQRQDDEMSLTDHYSSMQSLPMKSAFTEFECETDFRPRVNSGASDGYRQDSISTTSSTRRNQKCVAMYLHGIGQVGCEIRNDFVRVLQNKLNEGVLDQINMMLARNPLCMLTPEDVTFIQNPNSPPVHELYYTLPVKQLGYAHALHVYLQQNLLHFLYNPKYTDSRKETHFKAYSHSPMEWCQVDDSDTFLHHTNHALGRSGGKGIACVVLSLVTGQNKPFQTLNNLPPNPNAYLDGLSETEFDDLICTSRYTLKNERSPGPVALVRFQLWHVGKDNIEIIELNLKNAVKYALWDLILEYRVLTSPTSDFSAIDDPACYSEPTTPIRVRRSGLVNMETGTQTKEVHLSAKFQLLKEMSSSVPDITSKSQTSSPISKDIPAFKESSKPQSAKPEFISPSTSQFQPLSTLTGSKCDKGNLNVMFDDPIRKFFVFGEKIGIPTLSSNSLNFPSRHSTDFILRESIKIIKTTLRDLVPKVYLKTIDSLSGEIEYVPYDPSENLQTSSYKEILPGATKDFILIGRNEKQWRTYMGMQDLATFQELNMETVKSYQRHLHHVCEHSYTEKNAESTPSSPTFTTKCSSSLISTSPNLKSSTSNAPDSKISKSPLFIPRQRLFLMFIEDKEVKLYLYNFTSDTTQTAFVNFTRLIKWHHLRNSLLSNIVLQKLGVFHGLSNLYRADFEKPANEKPNDSDEPTPCTFGYVEQLIRHHTHMKEPHGTNPTAKSTNASLKSQCVVRSLKNIKPYVRFHLSSSANVKDPVSVHGCQFLETISSQRKEMQLLYNMWQTRGSSVNYPFDRVFYDLKRLARLSHYCLTPILFSPSWRYKVAPIRDHALEPFDLNERPIERQTELAASNRSRHSSGSSLKSNEVSSANVSRPRRMSGAAGYPGSNQASPKLRAKTPSEETWHTSVCKHYLQEYIQYLHTFGFVSLQTSETADKKRSSVVDDDKLSRSDSFSRYRNSMRGAQTHYLMKCLLGGLIVFELGLNDPYAFANVYSVERMRFKGYAPRKLGNQFTSAFLDELDKIKLNMNLHSFTFDYHLRMIHNYVSGRTLIFKNGYHITSFLDDFIKYYRKPPSGARNALYQGDLLIDRINMSGNQLYNYIISHNKLYNMTVLRMVPIIDNHMDTEYALVELSARKASYTDNNDVPQMGSFDVGVLINHNTGDIVDLNSLKLTYYIILTSQRDLYPKLLQFGCTFGSFQPVKASTVPSSELSSRKTSTVSAVTEKEKFESSGEESSMSVHSMDSSTTRTKKVSAVRGMCDEDVLYLGYYSSQESMMQQVLERQSEAAAKHLTEFAYQANIHCRRDFLWSSLLPRSLKEESSRDYNLTSSTSHDEFGELLKLVTIIPLNKLDDKLVPFMNMHISWYSTLAPVLKSKYADCHREFIAADSSSLYVMVTDSSCLDSFMLLKIDVRTNHAELSLVFREEPPTVEITEDQPNQRMLALQALVEGFVNACCFHLWTCILPI